jgi:tetratricopeptide (TPR) repeat protein
MEVPALLVFSFVLWWMEIFGLYILYILFIFEDFYFGILFEDTKMFLMFFGSIIVFVIAFFFVFPAADLLLFLCLLAIPLALNQMREEERILKEKGIGQDNEEINRLKKYIEREGGDAGIYIRLGYLYKDIGDSENALENFKKACELTKKDTLLVTEREIRSLEYEITSEKRKKTIICKHCGTHNYPTRIFCEKCKKIVGTPIGEYFNRLFKTNTRAGPIIDSLIVIFFMSALLFWMFFGLFPNLVFYGLIVANIVMFATKSAGAKFG